MMLKYKKKSAFEKSYGPDPRIYTDESPNYKKINVGYAKSVNLIPNKFLKIRKYIPKRTGQVQTLPDGRGWTWDRNPTSNNVEDDKPLVPYTYDDIVYCPECGWEVVENVVICEKCGVDLK